MALYCSKQIANQIFIYLNHSGYLRYHARSARFASRSLCVGVIEYISYRFSGYNKRQNLTEVNDHIKQLMYERNTLVEKN